MSLFVLDTDILSLYQAGHVMVRQHVAAHAVQELATTVLSVEEQMTGWYSLVRRAKQADKLARAYQRLADSVPFLATFRILSFDIRSINRFESLRQLKLNVRKTDLRIAAVVLEIGATLVTRNLRDFKQVPGLVIEDWSQ